MTIEGLLLAAGAGRRMGQPKALVRDDDGTSWLLRAVQVLQDGGCSHVTVVLGAAVDEPTALLEGTGARIVVAPDWSEGMSASLRAGLREIGGTDGDAVVITLVDLPDVSGDVVERVTRSPVDTRTLRRAAYANRPGHPVVLGREHWQPVIESAVGDRGARDYLSHRDVELIECGDLATGRDVDSR
ncbi:nucleotidyltransferase family protein [Branchiibius sp. NY16-3462-2]|uniref:nucleotidyltransferase family protein n=1 Tax=Branchiibius sp. NY16-3462-2 TaxID=1807500 RepID=UPI00079A0E53|nr:nucleotidyltransferase family protein [Branchiibius sp. NY16-3462-2]KYH43497.1 molybdopterin-guanine dinucleotide biosynthesis protein MobA [Branchiibius sp. NY16-3462-2]